MRYNKLVRDKIPKIIEGEGKKLTYHIATESEFKRELNKKLYEEVDEFIKGPSTEELADILEVVDSLCDLYGIDKKRLEKIRREKKLYRGGFKKRIILEETW